MITRTIDERIDMAKYKCRIMKSWIEPGRKDFPRIEENWAYLMAGGNPYELRFDTLPTGIIQATLFVFSSEEEKELFNKENVDIVIEQFKKCIYENHEI